MNDVVWVSFQPLLVKLFNWAVAGLVLCLVELHCFAGGIPTFFFFFFF